MIKCVSDSRQVGDFVMDTPVFSTNKTEYHDITEILLKVALSTISLIPHSGGDVVDTTLCDKGCQ